jgi:nonsense-mediated mRNA decay protein 3
MLNIMKCILCGENEAFKLGLCKSCLSDKIHLKSENMDLTVCPKCGAVRLNKKWHYDNMEKYIIKNAISHIIMDKDDKISSVMSYKIDEDQISMEVVVDDRNLGDIDKEVAIHLKTYKESCPVCNKVTGSYYESVIQLRTLTTQYSKILEEAKDTIVKFMKNLNKQDPNSFISHIDTLKEGLDIFLGKKEDAVKIDKLMELDYFCNMKITKSLAGRKDSKDLFRYTHLIRILDLEKGSVIYNKAFYIIKNIKSNTMELVDINGGGTAIISSKAFFRSTFRIVMKEPEAIKFIVLSSKEGESQLMNSRTFEIITYRKSFTQKEVTLYKYEGIFYSL